MFKTFFTSPWLSIRNTFKKIHLWLGLLSALILTIVCLSGTLYIFKQETLEVLNRNAFKIAPVSKDITPEELISKTESQTGNKVASITIPEKQDKAWIFNVKAKGRHHGQNYFVNPHSGAITSYNSLKGAAFFSVLIRLHRWLLLDTSIGRPIVGWSSIIMSLLIISGLIIWLPRKIRYWRKGLRVRFSKNKKRLPYDLHKGLGFYATIFILLMSLTGPFWSFSWYRQGIISNLLNIEMPSKGNAKQAHSPRQTENSIKNQTTQKKTLPFAGNALKQYLATAKKVLPYAGTNKIYIPTSRQHSVIIEKNKNGFFAPPGTDKVEIDTKTGDIISLDRFTDKPFNLKLMYSMRALHTGSILGYFSKILYFLAGLIASSLPLTGVLIWMNRKRKKQKKDNNHFKKQNRLLRYTRNDVDKQGV
jgi:uncharacterized iron-regulated membrane protein